MTRRFVVDARLARSLAARLVEAAHEAVHVMDLGLLDATDVDIRRIAGERGAAILSKDEHLVTLAVCVGSGPRVPWLHVGDASPRARLSGAFPQIVAALDANERVIEVR